MLETIESLTRRIDALTVERRELAAAAYREGISAAEIAAAAGVSRQAVYRWLKMEGAEDVKASPRGVMREALEMMVGYLPAYQASQIANRARHGSEVALLNGVMMARQWAASPGVSSQMSEEDKALLSLASDFEVKARARQSEKG